MLDLEADVLLQDELNHPSLCLLNHRIRRSLGIPIVSLVHHLSADAERCPSRAAGRRALERRYLRSVDGFIFNSEATRRAVLTQSPCADGTVARPGRDHVVPPVRVHERNGPFTALYLGNIVPHKGLDLLVRAIGALPPGAVRLEVAGSALDDTFLRSVRNLVDDIGLNDQVRFLGRVTYEDRTALLTSSHVLVVPSFHEGYGLVIVEAMAFGLLVIAPISDKAEEILTDGREGLLVRPGDVQGLVASLRALSGDTSLREPMYLQPRERFDSLPIWREELGKAREYLLSLAARS